jgi:hypothetical protein
MARSGRTGDQFMSTPNDDVSGQSQPPSGSNLEKKKLPTVPLKNPHVPGFLDLLFGTPTAEKPPAPERTATPPAVATRTTKSPFEDKRTEPPIALFCEPDRPLKPHYAHPRAELIFTPPAPTVYVSPVAYMVMCLIVELAPKEVGWLGTVSKRPDGNFMIEEVFLVEQEVTSVETELSADGCAKLVMELLEGGEPGLERANKLRFWGHSHVRMGTSPSGTDELTMKHFASEGHEFYVRGIFNKLGRSTFDVYYFDKGYRILDVPWAVMDPRTDTVLLDQPSYLSSYSGLPRSTWRDILGADDKSTTGVSSGKDNFKLPEALVIPDALRKEVAADYNEKVKVRTPAIVSWFTGSRRGELDNTAQQERTDNPSEIRTESLFPGDNTYRRCTLPSTQAQPKRGSLYSWFCGLFETSPPPSGREPYNRTQYSQPSANHEPRGTANGARSDKDKISQVAESGESVQPNSMSPTQPDRGEKPS